MEGGLNGWKGFVAEGELESGMAYFSPATKTEEFIALAWYLEGGSRRFYSELLSIVVDEETVALYKELAKEEENHQMELMKLYRDFLGPEADPGFPETIISQGKDEILEPGVLINQALQWARGKREAEILEFSLSLETNAFDLYIKMERQVRDKRSSMIFLLLSEQEKRHLELLTSLFEKRV